MSGKCVYEARKRDWFCVEEKRNNNFIYYSFSNILPLPSTWRAIPIFPFEDF